MCMVILMRKSNFLGWFQTQFEPPRKKAEKSGVGWCKKTQYCVTIQRWWEQRDLNPPQRISSETTSLDEATVCRIATGRRSSWSSTVSKPTRRHSCATGARDTTKLYYTPIVCHTKSSLGLSASALTAS